MKYSKLIRLADKHRLEQGFGLRRHPEGIHHDRFVDEHGQTSVSLNYALFDYMTPHLSELDKHTLHNRLHLDLLVMANVEGDNQEHTLSIPSVAEQNDSFHRVTGRPAKEKVIFTSSHLEMVEAAGLNYALIELNDYHLDLTVDDIAQIFEKAGL